jgi:hypothetical protein
MGEARDIAMEIAEALGMGETGKSSGGEGAGGGAGAEQADAGLLPPPIEGK